MRHTTLCASLLALIAASPALAQETTAATDDIVISANLIPLDQDRTGVKVAVVDDADLRKAGQAPLTDTLARLPGVTVTRNGGFGTSTTVRIRGAEGHYVPVYIDGILVTDAASAQPVFDMGAMMTADVGRIEVLYGSQSALYGGSAVGGVINIETRAALDEGRHSRFALEAGSNNTRAASIGFTERTDRVEQALTLSHLHTDGFSASKNGTERDGAEATRLSYATRYQMNDALAVGGSAFAAKGWNDYDGYDMVTYEPADEANRAHKSEVGARVFAEYATGATTHTVALTSYRVKRRYDTAFDTSHFDGGRIGLGYHAATDLSDRIKLVYGGEVRKETAETTGFVGGQASSIDKGLFVQGLFTPREGLDLSASLRADHNSDFGSHVTGRLAFAAQVGAATTLRGALASGFRAPSLFERYTKSTYVVGNPDLTPEESTSVELGVDQDFGAGRVSATLFQIKTDNLINYVWGPVGTYENLPGTTTRKGAELSGEWALSDRVTLTGGYTYIDATDATGARLKRIPRHDLNLGLEAMVGAATTARIDLRHASGVMDAGGELEGFTVVNLGATHALSDSAEAYLRIENLFDEHYQVIKGYSTPGRSVYAGLRARF